MISAVTAKDALRFAVYEGNTTAATFIDFCKRLLHDAPGPIFLIVDGHPAHRAKATTAFAASTGGRLRLFFLPGYSPHLNPARRFCGWRGRTRAGVISGSAVNSPGRRAGVA
jgi:transposase